MKKAKTIFYSLAIAASTVVAIAASFQQQALGAADAPEAIRGNNAIEVSSMLDRTDFGALRWCRSWCTTVDSTVNAARVDFALGKVNDADGVEIKGKVHFLLVSASTNITYSTLRSASIPGRLVAPTTTTDGDVTRASHQYNDVEAGIYQVVTIVSIDNEPGHSNWGGYVNWTEPFEVRANPPGTQTSGCNPTGCLQTQTSPNGRMRINGVITGTSNGSPIGGDLNIVLVPAHTAFLLTSFQGNALMSSPLPGFVFTPTVSAVAGGRSFTLDLVNVRAGHWRVVRSITFGGVLGNSSWDGSYTWHENTLLSQQYLPATMNNLVVPE